jgi:hypothetical protein
MSRTVKKNVAFAIYAIPMGASTEKGVEEISMQYHDFKDVFEMKNIDILLDHRLYDYTIELRNRALPSFRPIYNLPETELAVLHKYIHENLSKNFIRHSKSLARALILFIKKKDELLRMYMDYRGLNKITKKNRFPSILILKLLEQLGSAKIFTKIDWEALITLFE